MVRLPVRLKNDRDSGKAHSVSEGWFGRNSVAVYLLLIVLLAFFVRAWFAFEPSVNNSPIPGEFVVSGGSDSYYHKRIIDYVVSEHRQMRWDPMLNYPIGAVNPRPPLWQWSVVVMGYVVSPFAGDISTGVWYSFIFSTAFWGALSMIPIYFITRTMFGKKAGLAAAFLFAIEAGHIERTVLTNADHDSFAMFFTLVGFYFFLKALKVSRQEKWVETWRSFESIKKGFLEMVRANEASLIYSAMAGVSIAAVALTWKGYSYIIVILGVYMIAQCLINRFRDVDSTTVTAIFFVMSALIFLVAFPWYYDFHKTKTWFDTPFYLSMAIVLLGVVFAVTRDYPWTLVLPILGILIGVGSALTALLAPDLWQSIVGGQGYLVKNKLYTTIAEAQAPQFSRFVLSFGVATFFMAFFGVGYAIWNFPKNPKSDYLFITVWAASTLYMAASAARFLFVASPAFAVMSGWILSLLVERIDFGSIRKAFRAHGGGKRGLKKSLKLRHVLGSLFIFFLILLPNAWYAVDAGIPYETKPIYDYKVYKHMPDVLRPKNYDAENGTIWYFGAFGYSMPVRSSYWQRTSYWPNAWWNMRQRDADEPPSERPGFVSWWDYGFEAIQEGQHPACADNFQYGYQWAGNVLMSQGEDEAIALFIERILDGVARDNPDGFPPEIRGILREYIGQENTTAVEDAYYNPEKYVQVVLDNPDVYGPRSSDLSPRNAKYTFVKVVLVNSIRDDRKLVDLYREIRDYTGRGIRYFAVDSRLFPFSARNTGIFYAPAVLSDHRVRSGGNRVPYDFYEIKVVTDMGEYLPGDVPREAKVEDYKIEYKDMFYNSMLYRCYIGYTGKEAGRGDGIPVVTLGGEDIKPAWAMKHFKLVYRTFYWNPYKDYRNHTTEWRAVSYEEAQELSKKDEGVLLPSYAGVYHGVVFIEYYDGAYLNGTVTLENGEPAPHVLVTVRDEYGIPHDYAYTDENGRYSVLLPFGNITVVLSTGGNFDSFNKVEKDQLDTYNVYVEDYQAMREKRDENGDGIWDFNIEKDFTIQAQSIKGRVYFDEDNNRQFSSSEDEPIVNATVTVLNETYGIEKKGVTDSDGKYEVTELPPLSYMVHVEKDGITVGYENTTVGRSSATLDFHVAPGTVECHVLNTAGEPVDGATVYVSYGSSQGGQGDGDSMSPVYTAVTSANGSATFETLLPGTYTVWAEKNTTSFSLISEEHVVNLGENETEALNLTLRPMVTVDGSVSEGSTRADGGGSGVGNAAIITLWDPTTDYVKTAVTDRDGRFSVSVPEGKYIVEARRNTPEGVLFGQVVLETTSPEVDVSLSLVRSFSVSGTIFAPDSGEDESSGGNAGKVGVKNAHLFFSGPVDVWARTDNEGRYSVNLPPGDYTLVAYSTSTNSAGAAVERFSVNGPMAFDVKLGLGYWYNVTVYDNASKQPMGGALLHFTAPPEGVECLVLTSSNGNAYVLFPYDTSVEVSAEATGYTSSEPQEMEAGESLSVQMVPVNPLVFGNVTTGGSDGTGGSPLAGATVHFFLTSSGGEPWMHTEGYSTTTDGLGRYNLSVYPGTYRIEVEKTVSSSERFYASEKETFERTSIPLACDLVARREFLVHGNATGFGAGSVSGGGSDGASYDITVLLFDTDGNRVDVLNGTVDYGAAPEATYSFFCPEGDYNVVVFSNDTPDNRSKVAVFSLSVHSGLNTNISFEAMSAFSGEVNLDIANPPEFDIPIEFTDEDTGMVFKVHVTPSSPGFYLPAPSDSRFTVDIDVSPDVPLNGLYSHVYYHAASLRPSQKDISPEITPLEATVKGRVTYDGSGVEATLNFYAQGVTGMDNFDFSNSTGEYTISLIPGKYMVYVAPTDTSYSLSNVSYVEVPADSVFQDSYNLDFTMVQSTLLRGHVYYTNLSGVPRPFDSGELDIKPSFVETKKPIKAETDADGNYEILLPPGSYTLSASTTTTEYGMSNTYSAEVMVTLSATASQQTQQTRTEDIKLSLEHRHSLSMTIDPPSVTASANETIHATLTIKNNGNVDDEVQITSEISGWDVEFSTNLTSIPFLGEKTIGVAITLPPDVRTDHPPVKFKATSKRDNTATAEVTLDVNVPQIFSTSVYPSDSAPVFDGSRYTVKLVVNNSGNGPQEYNLTIVNAEELSSAGWNVYFENSKDIRMENQSISSGEKKFTVVAEATTDNPDIGVPIIVAVSAPSEGEKTVSLSFTPAALSVEQPEASGENVYPPPDTTKPFVVFVVLAVIILLIGVFFGTPKRRKRYGRSSRRNARTGGRRR